jgi:hypothetical protein
MDVSEWFDEPEHADVLLHLSTAALAASAEQETEEQHVEPDPKRQRTEGAAAAPSHAAADPHLPHARSFHAHSLALCAQSAYFKARLSSRSSAFKPDVQPAAGSSSSRIHFKLVEQVEEDELEAMELLLRVMYSGKVDQPQDKAPALLLQALGLAHRFLASKACMGGLAAALSSIPTEAIDQGFLVAVFHERMRDTIALPSLAPLLKTCRDRLQQIYGDVPGVIASDELRGAFCFLPHAAVLAWLQLEGLRVHSENCVVLLLSYWVEAQEEAERPCSPAELEQLAREVRVGDVGPAYLACLLPRLPLLEGVKQSLPALGVYLRSRAKPPSTFLSLLSTKLPPSWLLPPRSRCPAPLSATFSWSLDAAQLEQLYAGKDVFSPPVYCNGYWLGVYMNHPKRDTPGTQVGLFTKLKIDRWPSSLSGLWKQQGFLTCSFEAKIGGAAKQRSMVLSSGLLDRHQGWGRPSALSSAVAASVKELVAPYLEEGRLNVKVEFKQVDQVRTQRGRGWQGTMERGWEGG